MTFLELVQIVEVLNIVKKAKDNPDYSPKEPTKQTFPSRVLPGIKNFKIVISGHTKETRKGEEKPRDFGFTDNDYKRILTLFIDKLEDKKLKHGKYLLFYKSKKTKYDAIAVKLESNKITVTTIIQQSKNPNEYVFSKDNDSERILLENCIHIILE